MDKLLKNSKDEYMRTQGEKSSRVFFGFIENSDGTSCETSKNKMAEICIASLWRIHRGSRQENVWIRILFLLFSQILQISAKISNFYEKNREEPVGRTR